MKELAELIDMPIPEFETLIEALNMGELMSLRNFLAITYEQIRHAKDASIVAIEEQGHNEARQDALIEVYAKLILIEEKHNRVNEVISRREKA